MLYPTPMSVGFNRCAAKHCPKVIYVQSHFNEIFLLSNLIGNQFSNDRAKKLQFVLKSYLFVIILDEISVKIKILNHPKTVTSFMEDL